MRWHLTAFVFLLAHTLGEFGVVLMVGGNIPGQTKLISIAIYEHVETLNYAAAHITALLLLGSMDRAPSVPPKKTPGAAAGPAGPDRGRDPADE